MALLLPPDLDARDEERLAAEAIARVSGTRTIERIDSQIEVLRQERELALGGATLPAICPELSNANPSSPHTVLLEAQAWLLAQLARRINQLPVRDQIEFHRLFGIELKEATAATTVLEFFPDPDLDPPIIVIVPAGTQVATFEGDHVFETITELVFVVPDSGTVIARRTVPGKTLLGANLLTEMVVPIFGVESVTNPEAVDSGSETELVDQALARARNYQRRAERLVSARDLEDMVFEEILQGTGIVKAFPFIKEGDFAVNKAGHTTIVAMTSTGNALSVEIKTAIAEQLLTAIGNQFIYVIDPVFEQFSVEADIKVESIAPQLAITSAVEKNLRDFYATRKGNFGRSILRSEIIAVIEGTPGVDRIASDANGPIVGSPAADIPLAPYELPKLNAVTLNVVP